MQQVFRERLECSQPGDMAKKTLCVTVFCIYIYNLRLTSHCIYWLHEYQIEIDFRCTVYQRTHKTKWNSAKCNYMHADFTYSIIVRCILFCICNIVAVWFTQGNIVCGYVYSLGYGSVRLEKGNVFMKPFILPWIFVRCCLFFLLFVSVQKYSATLSLANTLCT